MEIPDGPFADSARFAGLVVVLRIGKVVPDVDDELIPVGGEDRHRHPHRRLVLVEGRAEADGRFRAERVQAKCASKYEAAPGGTTGAPASPTQQSNM